MNVDFNRFLHIGMALSTEQDYNKLLDMILFEAMSVAGADAGTLYVLEGDALKFQILHNQTMGVTLGGRGEPVGYPPVPLEKSYICACAALQDRIIQIDDVYSDTQFDFSGSKNYDALTGYTTRSMLVMPLHDREGNITGVLQLLNAKNKAGEWAPFPRESIELVKLLSSFSAIALTNMQHSWELKRQMFSFFNVIMSAVEARTPYNASHTIRIVRMMIAFIDFARQSPTAQEMLGDIDDAREEAMIISAWLHDIGKLVVPLSIMNKATRLGESLHRVYTRLEQIQMLSRIERLEEKITEEEWQQTLSDAAKARALVERVNTEAYVSDADIAAIDELRTRSFTGWEGTPQQWLTQEESECLCIRKGTLTANERQEMQRHAVMTTRLLGEMNFSKAYDSVKIWAGQHHEKLNGTGYPDGLCEEALPMEVRLLTILDIFEALTTDERPYKKSMPPEQAFDILYDMAKSRELDGDLITVFEQSRAWERIDALEAFSDRWAFDILHRR